MYHAESIINGVLHHRGTPDGEWIPYTAEQLTEKYISALERHSADLSKWQSDLEEENKFKKQIIEKMDKMLEQYQ